MKLIWLIARILLVICLPVVFISASIALAFNSLWLYQAGFARYDIAESTGLERSELDLAARSLIEYFNSDQELIDIVVTKNGQSFDLFNQKEILHLKDVKGLVQLDYAALIFSTLYVLIFGAIFLARKTGHWQQLAGSIVQGSLLSLGLIALLGIISLIDFNWLFVQFHLLSFANDLWLLNPDTDYLIMMFPQGFWVDAALLVACLTVAGATISAGGAYRLIRLKTGLAGD